MHSKANSSSVVAVLLFVLVATIIAVYELGFVRGEIAAMESEGTR